MEALYENILITSIFSLFFMTGLRNASFFKLIHRYHPVKSMTMPVSWENVALIHHMCEKRKNATPQCQKNSLVAKKNETNANIFKLRSPQPLGPNA